jgi:hypothetical protein
MSLFDSDLAELRRNSRRRNKINTAASKILLPAVLLPAWNGGEREPEYKLRCGNARNGFRVTTELLEILII